MTAVTIVGMAAGGVLIIAAVAVFLSKKEFPAGGVMVTLVGLILIGMSQWSTIKITAAGATVEVARDEIRTTAEAVDAVAEQTQQAAAAVEATRQQLSNLTAMLENRQVLSAAAVQPIRTELSTAPRIDAAKLKEVRDSLKRVIKR
jgi:hypothetical protein